MIASAGSRFLERTFRKGEHHGLAFQVTVFFVVIGVELVCKRWGHDDQLERVSVLSKVAEYWCCSCLIVNLWVFMF